METIENSVEVLNDLIEINNDRVAGFERAAKDLGDGSIDLKTLFEKSANESRLYVQELTAAVRQLGGEAEQGHTGTGTLHRAWLEVKATFTGHDRKSILEECERGEDAIKKAYRDALSPSNDLSAEVMPLISRQEQSIIASHDRVKALRSMQS